MQQHVSDLAAYVYAAMLPCLPASAQSRLQRRPALQLLSWVTTSCRPVDTPSLAAVMRPAAHQKVGLTEN